MVEQIRAAGGEIYAITSEPQRLADQAKASWDLNYEAIGDLHHEISGACRERGLLEIYVNERTELLVSAAGQSGNTGDEKTVKYSHSKATSGRACWRSPRMAVCSIAGAARRRAEIWVVRRNGRPRNMSSSRSSRRAQRRKLPAAEGKQRRQDARRLGA